MIRFPHISLFFSFLLLNPLALPLPAAVEYEGDGILSDRLESQRWYINRARYGPEFEADRFGLVNSTPGGSPDYDVCEDVTGTNDFGTSAGDWAPWRKTIPPLAPNERMNIAAANHSMDLVRVLYLTHNTPTGSPFYATGVNGITRMSQEGYTNSIFGYYENLNYGARASFGSFPAFGLSPEGVHTSLFVDTGISSRGHRRAIINPVAREIGLGSARTNIFNWQGSGFYWTIDYDTQDYGREGSNHFFTGTIFYDANSNAVYDSGEGRPGIEVRLFDGTNEADFFDVSQTSGNFAIPIQTLADGNEIAVQLVNASGVSQEVTVPLTFSDLGTFTLTSGASRILGYFSQPMGRTNVGFRNLVPAPMHTALDLTGSGLELSFGSMRNIRYESGFAPDLEGGWIGSVSNNPDQESTTLLDPGMTATQRFYRTRMVIDGYPY